LFLFKFFKLYSKVLFLKVSCEEVHVLVPVGSSLLFCSFFNAFGLLLLLSFALFSSLRFLLSDKHMATVSKYHIGRIRWQKLLENLTKGVLISYIFMSLIARSCYFKVFRLLAL
jgi:hypothetical protein